MVLAIVMIAGIAMSFSKSLDTNSSETSLVVGESFENVLSKDESEVIKEAHYSDSTFIIKYKDDVDLETRKSLNELYQVEEVGELGKNEVILRVKEDIPVEEILEKYSKDEFVEYSEPDYICEFSKVPNDPYYSMYQAAAANASGIPGAWDYTTGSDDIIVAVIDSGCVSEHEDLAGRIIDWYSPITGMSPTTDNIGHGTAVTGTVAAIGNNRKRAELESHGRVKSYQLR